LSTPFELPQRSGCLAQSAGFFDDACRKELLNECIGKNLTNDAALEFIRFCEHHAKRIFESLPDSTAGERKERLQRVAASAAAVVIALDALGADGNECIDGVTRHAVGRRLSHEQINARGLEDALGNAVDGLPFVMAPWLHEAVRTGHALPLEVSANLDAARRAQFDDQLRGMLGLQQNPARGAPGQRLVMMCRDALSALAMAAENAAEAITPDKNASAERDGGRGLVHLVVGAYRARTGSLPPKGQDAWFARFMQKIAERTARLGADLTPVRLGLVCGPKVVRDEIRAVE
jgi:hypothetical protein